MADSNDLKTDKIGTVKSLNWQENRSEVRRKSLKGIYNNNSLICSLVVITKLTNNVYNKIYNTLFTILRLVI